MECMCQSLIRFFAEEIQYVLRTAARPFNQLMVSFRSERSATMFRNKPFVSHLSLHLSAEAFTAPSAARAK